MRLLTAIVIFCCCLPEAGAQVVFQHTNNTAIYDFLDELSNMKVIELNSAVKPYSRIFIAEKLMEADSAKAELNNRQRKELEFFLEDYGKELEKLHITDYLGKRWLGKNIGNPERRHDLFYFRDSVFMFSLNPILGAEIWNTDSRTIYHRFNGADAMMYAGNRLGIYANLRDNYLSRNINGPQYLTTMTGGSFKAPTFGFTDKQAVEYSEMRGGINWNGKYGNIGLVKDHVEWGNNYFGPNIFSNRAPSFAQLRLNLKPVKWLELNYFHGWLSSKVIDTSRTQYYGTGTTYVYIPKYIAANMVTVTPARHLNVSLGNSIIYSHNFNAAYLVPFLFYKSLDHTYSTLGNSQMFLDVSSRNLKHCHFYFTAFFDDFSFGKLFEKYGTNAWSFKGGARVSNAVKNVSLTVEYTRNNIFTYKHYNPETTFENTRYNMGHYLRDNAQDFHIMISYKPLPRLKLEAAYNTASKGPDYPDDRNDIDPVTGQPNNFLYKFQDEIIWEKSAYSFQVRYEPAHDLVVSFRIEKSEIKNSTGSESYTPVYFRNDNYIASLAVAFGIP